jgi:hypothetical protein
VTLMRDEVVAAGITVNGLPIMLNRPFGSGTDIPISTFTTRIA